MVHQLWVEYIRNNNWQNGYTFFKCYVFEMIFKKRKQFSFNLHSIDYCIIDNISIMILNGT